MEQRWDDSLSPEQKAAASHFGSHARLLAGPGTGKTYTLARHVAFLATEKDIPASQIAVLTFTRNATSAIRSEMEKELAAYTDERPLVSTLHGFSLRQLRRNQKLIDSLPQPLRIADSWEERYIIFEELNRLLGNIGIRKVKALFESLSSDWETLKADEPGWEKSHPNARFIGAWHQHRRTYGYTLRAELVYQLKRSLEQIPDFKLEPRFKYIIVDEYQDLNPCDLSVIREAASRGVTIWASGDDDQSIYGFRHASPDGIRNFTSEFPQAASLTLNECRRCDEEILGAATFVVSQDIRRIPKNLYSSNGRNGGEVRILRYSTGEEECKSIAELVQYYVTMAPTKYSPGGILILMRSDPNRSQSKPLSEALTKLGIPHTTKLAEATAFDTDDGRRLLSNFRLLVNGRDSLAWRTLLELAPGIGESKIKPLYDYAVEHGVRFAEALERRNDAGLSNSKVEEIVSSTTRMLDQTKSTIERVASDGRGETSDGLLEIVACLISSSEVEPKVALAVQSSTTELIETYQLKSVDDLLMYMLVDHKDSETIIDPDKVNIMTMHQAKGLTADMVIIVGAEDDNISRGVTDRELADDRRLLYVSMTRARHKLFISYATKRTGQQKYYGGKSGQSQRQITRFLRDSGIPNKDGPQFVRQLRETVPQEVAIG